MGNGFLTIKRTGEITIEVVDGDEDSWIMENLREHLS